MSEDEYNDEVLGLGPRLDPEESNDLDEGDGSTNEQPS